MANYPTILNTSFHKAAGRFLKSYYKHNQENSILFRYHFSGELAGEAKLIAKSVSFKEMDYQNAIVATWFSYGGPGEILMPAAGCKIKLLQRYFDEVKYPKHHREIVTAAIKVIAEGRTAATMLEWVVSDAVYSQLGQRHFMENLQLLRDEINRVFLLGRSELFYLKYYENLSAKANYYTPFAIGSYASRREKNARLIGERIWKLSSAMNY